MDEKYQKFIDEHVECDHADIHVSGYSDGTLYVALRGACSGCPGASATVQDLLNDTLMAEFDEIKEVVVEQTVSQELIDFAKKILNHEIEK